MQFDILTSAAFVPTVASAPNTLAIGDNFDQSLTRPATALKSPSTVEDSVGGNTDTEAAIDSFNEVAEPLGIALKFSRDEKSGRVVVEMVDQTTGETLRQIPDAAALRLSATLGKLKGLIFDRKV